MNLEMRLLRLERSTRRWRMVSVLLGFGLVLAAGLGQTKPVPDTIEAKEISFRDSSGVRRMALIGKEGGGTSKTAFALAFFNERGEAVGSLGIVDNRPMLSLKTCAQDILSALRKGYPKYDELPEKAKESLQEEAKRRGDISVSLGPNELEVSGASGRKTVVGSGMVFIDSGSLNIYDGQVNVVKGSVEVTDGTKNGGKAVLGRTATVSKTGAATEFPANTLTLYDHDGNVLFQAPH